MFIFMRCFDVNLSDLVFNFCTPLCDILFGIAHLSSTTWSFRISIWFTMVLSASRWRLIASTFPDSSMSCVLPNVNTRSLRLPPMSALSVSISAYWPIKRFPVSRRRCHCVASAKHQAVLRKLHGLFFPIHWSRPDLLIEEDNIF